MICKTYFQNVILYSSKWAVYIHGKPNNLCLRDGKISGESMNPLIAFCEMKEKNLWHQLKVRTSARLRKKLLVKKSRMENILSWIETKIKLRWREKKQMHYAEMTTGVKICYIHAVGHWKIIYWWWVRCMKVKLILLCVLSIVNLL